MRSQGPAGRETSHITAPTLIADGTDDYTHDSDGWTLRTATGARAAHSEHTIAVTRDGARILTR